MILAGELKMPPFSAQVGISNLKPAKKEYRIDELLRQLSSAILITF
jgi:hypothetical protein